MISGTPVPVQVGEHMPRHSIHVPAYSQGCAEEDLLRGPNALKGQPEFQPARVRWYVKYAPGMLATEETHAGQADHHRVHMW